VETRTLPVRLTEDEITQRGRAIAKFVKDQTEIEEAKKTAMSGFKEKLDVCAESIGKLSRSITTGEEDREVECHWNKDFGRRVADLIRNDTGEVVETRPLSADEMQEKLFPNRMDKPTGKKLDGLDGEATAPTVAGDPENPEGLGF
jgi:hypothetical protein